MDKKQAIAMIPALQAASPESLGELRLCGLLRYFKKGEHIFWEKDEAHHLYFLVKGTLALYKINSRQEKRVLLIYGPGRWINEEMADEKPAVMNCEMLSDGCVLCFEMRRFFDICERDFELQKVIVGLMGLKIRRLCRQMKNTSTNLRGDKRIAAKLWKLSRDHGVPCAQGIKIGFDLSITYLADLLGSKRETVSRQVKALTDKGLIIVSKNRFIIPDRDKLKEYFDKV